MAEPDDPMGQQVKRFGKGEVQPQDFLSDDGMMHRIGVEILPEQLPVADDFALQSAVAGRICRTDRPCEICQSVFRIGFGQIFGIGDPEPFGQRLLFGQYRHSGAKCFGGGLPPLRKRRSVGADLIMVIGTRTQNDLPDVAQVSEYEDEILANGEPGVEPERFPADQREGEQFAVGPSVAQQAVFDDYFPQLALRAGGVGVVVKLRAVLGDVFDGDALADQQVAVGQRGAEKCSQILVIDPVSQSMNAT